MSQYARPAALRAQPPDLVITDIYMPDRGGLEVIIELRKKFPTIKIIAISGNVSGKNALRVAETLGAQRTLRKPFPVPELVQAAEQLVEPLLEFSAFPLMRKPTDLRFEICRDFGCNYLIERYVSVCRTTERFNLWVHLPHVFWASVCPASCFRPRIIPRATSSPAWRRRANRSREGTLIWANLH